jgi:hypothetical protein
VLEPEVLEPEPEVLEPEVLEPAQPAALRLVRAAAELEESMPGRAANRQADQMPPNTGIVVDTKHRHRSRYQICQRTVAGSENLRCLTGAEHRVMNNWTEERRRTNLERRRACAGRVIVDAQLHYR